MGKIVKRGNEKRKRGSKRREKKRKEGIKKRSQKGKRASKKADMPGMPAAAGRGFIAMITGFLQNAELRKPSQDFCKYVEQRKP